MNETKKAIALYIEIRNTEKRLELLRSELGKAVTKIPDEEVSLYYMETSKYE